MRSVEAAALGDRVARRWLLALTGLALALRLPGWLGWWFNPDEAIYLEVATTTAERARAMVAANAHPPLQYALLRLLAPISTSPIWLRLPSLLAGVALVPLVHAGVRHLATPRTALAAAALVALSPSAAALSGVMRPYALQQAALALAFFGWAGWLAGAGRSRLALFAVGLCLALGLHYSSFAALAAFGAALAALGAGRRLPLRRGLQLAAAHVPPAATATWLYATHIATRLEGGGLLAQAQEGWLESQFARDAGDAFGRVTAAFEGLFGVGELALAFALVALVLGLRARSVASSALPFAALAAALALSFLGKYPLGGSRHSAWLLVFLAPLVAEGAVALASSRSRPLAAVGLLATLVLAAGSARAAVRLSRGRAHRAFLSEGVVRPGEAREVGNYLMRGLPGDPIVLTDGQTLNLLRAAVGGVLPRFRRQGDGDFAHVWLGEREFHYAPSDPHRPGSIPWELTWQRGRAVERSHVARALEQIDARPQLAERARTHGLWLALGGWTPNPAHPDPARDPAAPPLYDRCIGGPGLGLFRLDREPYAAYLAGD